MVEFNPDYTKAIEALRNRMREKHLHYKDLAEVIGVKPNNISALLSGGRLKLVDYLKMCDFCGLDLMIRDTGMEKPVFPSAKEVMRMRLSRRK